MILPLHVVPLSFICPGESTNSLCTTITFVKIDLHIHRQQEQVFDVFFHQGAARLDCSTREDELGWRCQQGTDLIKQGCSLTVPRQEEQSTSSSPEKTQRAGLAPPHPQ